VGTEEQEEFMFGLEDSQAVPIRPSGRDKSFNRHTFKKNLWL
jgi:hypothetical protein